MKKTFMITALFASMFVLQSCDSDDDLTNPGGNKEVENAFRTMYPDVTRVEWEKEGSYWTVDFRKNGKEMEAWFTTDGQWIYTETDLPFVELPEAVKTSFSSGEYKDWRVEDVDMIERKDAQTFYILDVEKGNRDYDLHYSPDGALIKAVADNS